MSRYSFAARVVCSLAFGCLAATPASAQREAGPFAGLFDRDRGDKRGQTLDVHASLFGMYDDDKISAQEPATIDDRGLLGSGAVGSIEASIGYKRRAKRARFHLSGGGLFQKYPAAHFFGAMYSATAGVDVNLTRKLVLDAKGGFSSTPFYQFAPFLSAGAVDASLLTAGNQFADLVLRNETLDGALTLTSNYSKRSSVSAEVSWNETRFLDSPDNNFRIFVSHAAFRHQITRPLAVHLGYGLEQARFQGGGEPPLVNHLIDVGVEYSDTLSFSRRTSFSFSTGTSIVHQAVQPKFGLAPQTEYRLDGTAILTRGIGRTWSASAEYRRGTNFVPGFRQPLFSDSVTSSIAGLIATHVQWSSEIGFSRGEIGFVGDKPFGVYSATSKIEYGITRSLGAFGQYTYYRYNVPLGSDAFELLPLFSRQAWMVGLTAWVPIIRR